MPRRKFPGYALALLVASCAPSPLGDGPQKIANVEAPNPETTEEITYHAPPELIGVVQNAIKKIPDSGTVSGVVCHRNTLEISTDSVAYPWIVVGSDNGNDGIGMYINFIDSQNGHRSIDYGMQQVEGNWKPDELVLSQKQQGLMVAAAKEIVGKFGLNIADPDLPYYGENCRSKPVAQSQVLAR